MRTISALKRLRLIVLAFALAGCSANPAAPPAPPAELPSALRFPETVTIDGGKTSTAALKLDVGTGPVTPLIEFGPGLISQSNLTLDRILKPLSAFDIPVAVTQTNFKRPILVNGALVTLKMDFSDYDFDDDGVNEGCSGHTAALPICYRIWVDGKRRVAGIFTDQFPTAGVVGAGLFRGVPIDAVGDVDKVFFMFYDHINEENKTNDFILNDPTDTNTGPFPHIRVNQAGPDATALKTLQANFNDFVTINSRWREDADSWLGTFVDDLNLINFSPFPDIDSFTNLCAQISTGDFATDPASCTNDGLNLDDLAIIPKADPAATHFPIAFPTAPTF